jgi:hypothetical protein
MDQPTHTQPENPPAGKCPVRWYTRLGAFAFLFFLIKGLAWLAVPAVMAYLATK